MIVARPIRLIAAAFAFFFLTAAHAGEPLPKADFLDAIADPAIRDYVAEHFDLAEVGRALRAGRRLPNAGERIPPFEIVGHAMEESTTPVVLRLETAPSNQVTILPYTESVHYDSQCL